MRNWKKCSCLLQGVPSGIQLGMKETQAILDICCLVFAMAVSGKRLRCIRCSCEHKSISRQDGELALFPIWPLLRPPRS